MELFSAQVPRCFLLVRDRYLAYWCHLGRYKKCYRNLLAASLLTVTPTQQNKHLNTVKMLKHWVKVCYLAETYITCSQEPPIVLY